MRRCEAIGWGLILVLAAGIGWFYWGFSYDDAFVTYRYALRWAEHGELAYNPGEWILGTSAPGYALALGTLTSSTGGRVDPAGWGTVIALASLLATAVAVRRGLAGRPALLRLGVPLLYGIVALTFRWNLEMLGAETPPILTLVAWGALWTFSGRPTGGALLLSAAAILRLDAALAAIAVVTVLLMRDRRLAVRPLIAYSVPLAAYVAWIYTHFGVVVPQTMAAKQYELSQIAGLSYSRAEWGWLGRSLPPASCWLLLGLAAIPLGLALRRLATAWQVADRGGLGGLRLPEHATALALGGWVIAHEIAYRMLAVPFAPWYEIYLVNALLLLAVFGALLAAGWLAGRGFGSRRHSGWGGAIAALLATLLLLAVLRPWSYVWRHRGHSPDPRYSAYAAAGHWLRAEAPPGSSVAALEIGILGYTSGLRVLDLGGLVNPQALAAKRAHRLADFVALERPLYLLDANPFAEVLGPLWIHPTIRAEYREVAHFQDERGGLQLRLLRRAQYNR